MVKSILGFKQEVAGRTKKGCIHDTADFVSLPSCWRTAPQIYNLNQNNIT